MAITLSVVAMFPSASRADNPIVQHIYTADPAPLVYNGRVYLYTGHDEDGSTWFTMREWRVWSSADMVNWTDHGSPLSLSTFSWASQDAWAGQAIHRNGKFYWYVPVRSSNGGQHIGVAVSDSPTGPFTDPLGRPLISNAEIDPTVFIDDNGQAYLYYGNPNLWYVRLNTDMISYSGTPQRVTLTTQGFGVRSNTDRPTSYEEGPWFFKRNNLYYMMFAGGPIPEHIAYSTSPSATGPWTYRGVIMPTQGSSFTNHAGIVDFAGNSYFFYHNGALPGGGGFTRSVAVERFTYNADGTIPTINMTTGGAPQIGTLNPYVQNEAEMMAWGSGVETEASSEGGRNVGFIDNGDYIKVKGVNFGSGATSFDARVASATNGGNIELRLDSVTGTLVGTCSVQGTGGWQTWTTRSCAVSGATGIHDLYLRFTGGSGSLFNFNWWKFNGGGPTPTPSPTNTPPPQQTNPIAWYRFDETSGTTAADSSGSGRNASLVNGPTWVGGRLNNAVDLNGGSQHVSLPAGIVNGLNDFSIATWVRLDSTGSWRRLFDFGSNITTNMFLTPNNGSTIRFAITTSGAGGEQQINGTSALSTGMWHHVAVTKSGGTGRLYVDGVQVGQNTGMSLSPASLGSTTNNWIGRSQYSGDAYLDGQVDDFRIYNRALSAAEVQGLFNVGGGTPTPTPTQTPPPSGQLLTNGNAEAGTSGWGVFGSGTLAANTSVMYGGAQSLLLTGRTASWNGISQNVTAKLTNGRTYTTNVWIRSQSGTPSAKVTLAVTANGTTSYITLAPAMTVNASGWTLLSGTATVSWSGTLSNAVFYVETTTGTDSFYIDDASFQ